MSGDNGLNAARALLAAHTGMFSEPEARRLDAMVAAGSLAAAAGALSVDGVWHLSAITGLDGGAELQALYHFSNGPAIVTLRVRLPRAAPTVPSLCALLPNAGFFERELSEMFGIAVEGAPDTARLFLPDDWPDGLYPLRKDAALPEGEGGAHA